MDVERDPLTVAIDGPAGSGKSTVAAELARRLRLTHVDTGAMYRALTLVALDEGLALDDGPALGRRLDALRLGFDGGRLHLEGEDVEDRIRGEAVTHHVSQLSAHAEVRRAMVRRQRELSWKAETGAVMEGRDIGTVVLPLASCKIYLDAAPAERARRRALQLGQPLEGPEFDRLLAEIERRDALDSGREHSPLEVAPDAHVLDTSRLSLEEVVERCATLARESRFRPHAPAEHPTARYRRQSYRLVQKIVEVLARLITGVEVFGEEHQRVDGGLLYVSNHISWWDPPVVGGVVERELHFLAKSELFKGPFGAFIAHFNAIPIVRGRFDPVAFERAREVLGSGRNLFIFPEGTRKPVGRPGPVKRGLGILALGSERPYLPIYVRGTKGLWGMLFRRRPVQVWMGPPVRLHALAHLRERHSDAEIQARIGRLFLEQVRALAHRSDLWLAEHPSDNP